MGMGAMQGVTYIQRVATRVAWHLPLPALRPTQGKNRW